jgi:hypothetical protein
MNRIRNRLEHNIGRMQCNPSIILGFVALMIVLIVAKYHAMIIETAIITLGGIAAVLFLAGTAMIGHTIYSWRKAKEAGTPRVTRADRRKAHLATMAGVPTTMPVRDTDPMAADADTLADPDVELMMSPEGEILQKG